MKAKKIKFEVVNSGIDEYPGRGLRLQIGKSLFDTEIVDEMRLDFNEGDEIEITAKVVSRVIVKRVKTK